MTTSIFNYNGTLLTTVPNNKLDINSSSIKFPGYGYVNYGEAVNENMLWILENFAGPTPPTLPVVGQNWFNTDTEMLMMWNGTEWIDMNTIIRSATPPVVTKQGTLWYDTENKQLNVWTGQWSLLGPLGSQAGTDPINPATPVNYSQFDAARISDGVSLHSVWRLSLVGTQILIISKDQEFIPSPSIPGFPVIYPGINFNSNLSNAILNGDNTIYRNNKDCVPDIDNVYKIGQPSYKFSEIYASQFVGNASSATIADYAPNAGHSDLASVADYAIEAKHAENASSANVAALASLAVNSNLLGTIPPTKFLKTYADALPDVTLAYDLGSPAFKWRNLYVGNLFVDSGTIINSIRGTDNQVIVNSSDPRNPVLSLPQSISPSNSVKFSSLGLGPANPANYGGIAFGDNTTQYTAAPKQYVYQLNYGPPSQDISLNVGDRLTLNFFDFSTLPLYVSSSPGMYKVILNVLWANSVDSLIEWIPNYDYGIGDSFELLSIEANYSSGSLSTIPYVNRAYASGRFNFDMSYGPGGDPYAERGPFLAEFLASTYTESKIVKGSTSVSGSASINTARWLNGDGRGDPAVNNTTPWYKLGFIQYNASYSPGTIFSGVATIERIS